MAEDREHDFWNLRENLQAMVAILDRLYIRLPLYADDYTKAFDVELQITDLLANIDSLKEAAKAVQDVSRPITEEILTASLCLRNRMFQYQFDLRRCMDGSEDGIAVHHPRNIYSHTIPHVRNKAQEYSAIFDNLRFKVEAESEMQKQQSTEESQEEPGWADNEPEVIEIDMALFYEGPCKKLLRDLILTPTGVQGTSQNIRNLRGILRDGKGDEYKKIAEHIHKKRNEDIIYVDTKKITLKVKNNPT